MSTTSMADRSLPRFGTILAARGNDSRPSDLEFLLRSHCDKMRVVERLHGGAHLLLPKVAGTSSSLAIRIYEQGEKMETGEEQETPSMDTFMDSFQMTVVFFVCPGKSALDDVNSDFHQAQRLMNRANKRRIGKNNTVETASTTGEKLMNRVCLVPNATTTLSILFSMVDAIQKREIRSLYFQRQQTRYFTPRPVVTVNSGGAGRDNDHVASTTPLMMIPESCRPHAAIHIAETLRSWANRFDLPPGEINVLMSLRKSLAKIATTANGLDMIPVEDRTKRLLRAFFGISSSHSSSA